MDAPLAVARSASRCLALVRAEISPTHPSAALLGEERHGAGVAVAPGRILTAHYLVMGASQVQVSTPSGQDVRVHRIVVDHDSGLALLHVADGLVRSAPPRTAPPWPGLPVFLLSLGSDPVLRGASGHVIAVGPFEAFWEYMLDRAVMTTIVNPGLAGGGLFDDQGRLLGIVSLGLAAVARYSLAVPLALYRDRQEVLERGETGDRRRAWMGFFPQGQDGGVVLTGFVPGSPADESGLERGDLIVSLDGHPVRSVRELYGALWMRTAGDAVSFQILRDRAVRHLEVVAGDRYEFFK